MNRSEVEALLLARETQLIARFEAEQAELAASIDTTWVLSSAVLVLLMQLGFAMLEAGSVRSQNVVATYAKNILDFVIGAIVATAIGYFIAYDVNPFDLSLEGDPLTIDPERFFFHVAFQATGATIVSGAMAERVRIIGYTFLVVLISLSYCVVVRMTWGGGWLYEGGFHDFAGSGIVHLLGGSASFVGCYVVGSRMGRWENASKMDFVPHNIPSVMWGTLLLFVGWFGFNAGSTFGIAGNGQRLLASFICMNTVIAASAAAGSSIIYTLAISSGHRLDILGLSNVLLSGLVAITGGCDVMSSRDSAITGLISMLVYFGSVRLCERLRVDDVVSASAVHGANGLWGLVAVGLFHHEKGLFIAGEGELLGWQLLGAVVIIALGTIPTAAACIVLKKLALLRVTVEQEVLGLDVVYGLAAYVAKSQALRRCSGAAHLLREQGFEPKDLLESLMWLKGVIYRPFTPQAADNKLEGEVADILLHLSCDRPDSRHVAFVSHHKEDAGDAARIFCDTARRVMANKSAAFGHLLHETNKETPFFLDSTNLKDLNKLLDFVSTSNNHILLLSRVVLERPWVLAELCQAHKHHLNLCVVLVEYSKKQEDPKFFRFPEDLDTAIVEWTEFLATERKQSRSRAGSPGRDTGSLANNWFRFGRLGIQVASPVVSRAPSEAGPGSSSRPSRSISPISRAHSNHSSPFARLKVVRANPSRSRSQSPHGSPLSRVSLGPVHRSPPSQRPSRSGTTDSSIASRRPSEVIHESPSFQRPPSTNESPISQQPTRASHEASGRGSHEASARASHEASVKRPTLVIHESPVCQRYSGVLRESSVSQRTSVVIHESPSFQRPPSSSHASPVSQRPSAVIHESPASRRPPSSPASRRGSGMNDSPLSERLSGVIHESPSFQRPPSSTEESPVSLRTSEVMISASPAMQRLSGVIHESPASQRPSRVSRESSAVRRPPGVMHDSPACMRMSSRTYDSPIPQQLGFPAQGTPQLIPPPLSANPSVHSNASGLST